MFDIELMLQLGTGLFWTLVYLIIIYKGFKDKTYGMPLAAICTNISWEFIFSFIYPHDNPQHYVDIIWFVLDTIILLQFLKFGKENLKGFLPPKLFYPTFLLMLMTGFFTVLFVSIEFQDKVGKYAAFGTNMVMSILFIVLLLWRDSTKGQSLYIAVFKMLGTLLPSILFFVKEPSILIGFFSIAIFVFDWIYITLLYRKFIHLKKNLCKRL